MDCVRRFQAIVCWALALDALSPVQPTGSALYGQGVTTATIAGTVHSSDGLDADGALVRVTNRSTGYEVATRVRHGRFVVAGLEVGGPYVVEVRRIGVAPVERGGIVLTLGQRLDVDFVVDSRARLDTVHVISLAGTVTTRSRAGTATTISESVLQQMPALNRDMLDFARLVPQVGTRFGGLSGSGVGFRFNSYLIDGVSERQLNGNGALSGIAGGKPISIDAVKEYEVLLAPYDVRYGDFAGALVNAVTKSGTNELHGSAFVYTRNEQLARNAPFLREAPYDRSQLGFSVGGPIVRDRAHYFVAAEVQRMQEPATGPYVGQRAGSPYPVPAAEADVARFANALGAFGLDAGSGGQVTRFNPNANIFARADVALPGWRSRLVIRHNHAGTEQTFFSRTGASRLFPLTSNAWTNRATRSTTAAQVFTQLPRGALNELLVSHSRSPNGASQFLRSPRVEVEVPGNVSGQTATLMAGAPDIGQGSGSRMRTIEVADHLSLRAGNRHTISLGARAEWFSFRNISTRAQFGRYTFLSLDSLERGEAATFRVEKDFGSATRPMDGVQFGTYVGDAWRPSERLSLTAGVRADVLTYSSTPTYNPAVETIFGRRNSDFPGSTLSVSPRVGFDLDLDATHTTRLRGGAGVFAVRPPLAWMIASQRFDGIGTRTLSCVAGFAPAFNPDTYSPPASCTNGTGFADGPVYLTDPGVRMTEMFRSSLAYDRVLPWDVTASIEGLYTRTLSDFLLQNARLAGPQGLDRYGRVLYGVFNQSGVAQATPVSTRFPEVIDLRRHGNGHSLALTARAQKRVSERLEVSSAYTRTRVRDVQSITAGAPPVTFASWAGSRPMSGFHEQLATGVSSYEIPHRVVLTASWTAPWQRWGTSVSVYYIGESGIPFTYTDSTAAASGPNGDLNADGTNANDPIYIPRNASDTSEIMFGGTPAEIARQQAAFESFIARTPCLNRQRGRIMARNSCKAPSVHTSNAALRQSLPSLRGHGVSLELEVFNVLNLIHRSWGLYKSPTTILLNQIGRTPGSATASQPIFTFGQGWAPHSADNVESAYQLQLALRYRF